MTNTCCFIGHRKIERTQELEKKVYKVVEDLVVNQKIDTFLFGSRSEFNDLCYDVVTKLKEKYPSIWRIYVRGEYPYINDDYKKYLLQYYEDSYYPEMVLGAGKLAYIKRNYEMITKSRICVFYYINDINKGTKIAFQFAEKKKKNIINIGKI